VTGDIEPLILTAITNNKFHSHALSTVFPQDIIHVDLDPQNWVSDLAFGNQTTMTIVPGWKGTITFRHDTFNSISMGYDWRNVKYRRWKLAIAAYNAAQPYSKGNEVISGNFVYRATQDAPAGTAVTNIDYYAKVLSFQGAPYMNQRPNLVSPADFVDVKTFARGTFGPPEPLDGVRNVHIQPFRDWTEYWNSTGSLLSNNVFWLTSSGYYIFSNIILGGESNANTFVSNAMTNITCGSYFAENMVSGPCDQNSFGSFCRNNKLMTIDNNNFGHKIERSGFGEGFANNNVIGHTLDNAVFGNNVTSNQFNGKITNSSIGAQTTNCTYGSISNSTLGAFMDKCSFNTIDTCIVGKYIGNCTIAGNYQSHSLGIQGSGTSGLHIKNMAGGSIDAGLFATIFETDVNSASINAVDMPRLYAEQGVKKVTFNSAFQYILQYTDATNVIISVPWLTP
jgi:hypothetical protein